MQESNKKSQTGARIALLYITLSLKLLYIVEPLQTKPLS